MKDTLKERVARAKNVTSKYPNWIAFNTRFEGGDTLRDSSPSNRKDKHSSESSSEASDKPNKRAK